MKKDEASTTNYSRMTKLIGISLIVLLISLVLYGVWFEKTYENKVYPNVTVDDVPFGGKTKAEVQTFWEAQNIPFEKAVFEFRFDNHVATVSGSSLDLGYDATLSATQAFAIGRSGHFFHDVIAKFFGKQQPLSAYFRWKSDIIDTTLKDLSDQIDIPVQDALFQFEHNKVTTFKASSNGRKVNIQQTINHFQKAVHSLPHAPSLFVVINVPVDTITPKITTDKVNSFGIKELIGHGYSEFHGSIPGRIHNVALAADRVNGTLIPPGETFSFNDTVGDISAATGYQSAYIIKDGHTVLGDGGGVCQVSTTMFRAALDAGLPITERHAHAYRVHYYEDAGYKAGIDATVFSPSVDLKIKNDTPAYILIQTKTDLDNVSLTFDLYGTRDGRSAKITNHVVGAEIAPPPDLYQDDPTLRTGVIKQVDWAAWGAKASFRYIVTRGNDTLQDDTFVSNYRPWQAVYLKGTQ